MYRKFTAEKLFDGYRFLPENSVLVTDSKGIVVEVIAQLDAGDDVQQVSGMLCPGFINSHCHLELSHLKNKIQEGGGLTEFVMNVVGERGSELEQIADAMENAEQEMINSGIVAVGDICNTTHSLEIKKKSRLYYHNFVETMGFPEPVASQRFDAAMETYHAFREISPNVSIVPHAPYSVSEALMKKIAQFSANKIVSIHSQESDEENVFIKDKSGPLLKLYEKIGIDISFFQPTGKRSLDYIMPHLQKGLQYILVHNVITNQSDLNTLYKYFGDQLNDVYCCLCPNANQYISGRLPDVELLVQNNMNIILGTDSLASNHQLSIFDEVQMLQKNFPSIELTEMLRWATINGAKALQIDHRFGSFEKGKQPGVLQINGDMINVLV